MYQIPIDKEAALSLQSDTSPDEGSESFHLSITWNIYWTFPQTVGRVPSFGVIPAAWCFLFSEDKLITSPEAFLEPLDHISDYNEMSCEAERDNHVLNHERGLKIYRRLPSWHTGLCRSWEVFYTERGAIVFYVAKTQVELDLLRGGRVTGLDLDISPAVLD